MGITIEIRDGRNRKVRYDALSIFDQGLVLRALREEKPDFQGFVEVDLEHGLFRVRESDHRDAATKFHDRVYCP